ncbi:TPA: hypothetical protein EYP44_01535 [Candidatus Bathyarchaeota archaeon]|nr:hypothetical protein [Candidatus Bathyarchaeota archaeon]
MSGLIFTLLLGAAMSGLLGSLLRRDLGLEEMPVGNAWSGYVEESGYRVRVIVRRTDDKVEFILPDSAIPEEVCKRVVKKLSSVIYARLVGREVPADRIMVVGSAPVFCLRCLEPILGIPFRCHRCGGIFCGPHRLPERHDCPGGRGRRAREARRERRREEGEREEVVVTQAACG